MRGIGDLFGALQYFLPPWAMGVLAALVLLIASPAWFHNVRSKQIRTRLRLMGITKRSDDRKRLRDEAFELAGNHGSRLLSLAIEADKRGLDRVFQDAIARMEKLPRFAGEAEKLRTRRLPKSPPPRHPIEEAVFIERMAREGMLDVARRRLKKAWRRFPDDPDLVKARRVLDESAPPGASPPSESSTPRE